MPDFEVWRDNCEEWPAEGEPQDTKLGTYEAEGPGQAAALAAGDFDWCEDDKLIVRGPDGAYYEVAVELTWLPSRVEALDVATIRERP